MKNYLLFDLDGTLTDPKVGITTCVQYALRSFGIEERRESSGVGGEPQRREKHVIQRVDGNASAYGQLDRKNGWVRRGILRQGRDSLAAGRSSRNVFALRPFRGGTGG